MVEQMEEGGADPTEGMQSKTLINAKFNNPSTTPLTLEVVAGENTFTIDLKADGTGSVKKPAGFSLRIKPALYHCVEGRFFIAPG